MITANLENRKLRELGSTRTPFAIRGAGHNLNPDFSSTPGVQISMARFRDIVLNEEEGVVEIGAGLTWTEVYSYLVPRGLNVVGARCAGVGVGGSTLGGGKHSSVLQCTHSRLLNVISGAWQDILGRPISMVSQ
jgi:FAD/FMN-containing dehydrogenase